MGRSGTPKTDFSGHHQGFGILADLGHTEWYQKLWWNDLIYYMFVWKPAPQLFLVGSPKVPSGKLT